MTLVEIKKALYKQKPKANLITVTKSGILYIAYLSQEIEGGRTLRLPIRFLVPLSEIGDATFGPTGVEPQLLIRYIVQPEMSNHEDIPTKE